MIYNFVLINYNNSLVSLDCVKTISKFKEPHNILIVDNNSTDEQKNILKQSGIITLFLKDNIGYAGALNEGINYFYDKYQSNQIMIVGNNDLDYDANFCTLLSEKTFSTDTMIVCPNIIKSESGVHQNPYELNQLTTKKLLQYDLLYSNYYIARVILFIYRILFNLKSDSDKPGFEKSQFIAMGHGACYILLPHFLSVCKNIDSPTFLYIEELFLGRQILNNNGKFFYDKDLVVYHNEHTSTGKAMTKQKFYFMSTSYWRYRKSSGKQNYK